MCLATGRRRSGRSDGSGRLPGPPDFEIVAIENLPTTFDPTLAVGYAGDSYIYYTCDLGELTFDVTSAVINPDNDQLFEYWMVNRPEDNSGFVAADARLEFTLDPCTLANRRLGATAPNTVELLVLDRPPEGNLLIADVLNFVDPETTALSRQWTIVFEDDTCCADRPR